MKTIVVHNPTDMPVPEYPIEDPVSKKVNLWSIAPGKTLEFPYYVGEYLLEVYGFLQRVITQEELDKEKEEKEKLAKNKHFSQIKVVKKAEGLSVKKPDPSPGLTNDFISKNPEPYRKEEKKVIVSDPDPKIDEAISDFKEIKK